MSRRHVCVYEPVHTHTRAHATPGPTHGDLRMRVISLLCTMCGFWGPSSAWQQMPLAIELSRLPTEDDLELLITLPPAPVCWDYRCASLL